MAAFALALILGLEAFLSLSGVIIDDGILLAGDSDLEVGGAGGIGQFFHCFFFLCFLQF